MLFKDIIGQQAVKKRLIQSVKDNRISHAQLFLGSEGTGTLPLAMAYAQYIACTDKKENDSCGTCNSCIKYAKLVHPDLHFAYPVALSKDVKTSTDVIAQWREAFLQNPYMSLGDWFDFLDAENKQPTIAKDESHEILRKLTLTTYESEFKVMIIWMADKMNLTASNKLLKILEEPPDKTLFLLICETEDQMLKTILSRTQLVKLGRLTDEEIETTLVERQNLLPAEAKKITYLANGNYSQALKLVRESESSNYNLNSFQTLMRASLKFNADKVLAWVEDVSKIGREQQKNFLIYSIQLVRECLLLNYGSPTLVRLDGEELEFVKKFAPFINNVNCQLFIEELNKVHYQVERNANPKILFTDLGFKMNEFLNMK